MDQGQADVQMERSDKNLEKGKKNRKIGGFKSEWSCLDNYGMTRETSQLYLVIFIFIFLRCLSFIYFFKTVLQYIAIISDDT